MRDTKEKILLVSLRLFAQKGYEAISVSMIASELGIVKSALYKHYKSKQDIFDNIVKKMSKLDIEKAKENDMPEKIYSEKTDDYSKVSLKDIKAFTKAMFNYWTQEEFPTLFRKMLTIEQYHSKKIANLYRQYLSTLPLEYMEALFLEITRDSKNAKMLALEYYSPMYMLYSMYDTELDKESIVNLLDKHIDDFIINLTNKYMIK